jgi:ketosteroid isomerase-like protein
MSEISDILHRLFELGAQRDWQAVAEYWTDDVELIVAFESPEPEHYRGKEPCGRWFRDWFARFAPDYDMTIEELFERDSVALLTVHHRGVGRASGVPVEATFYCVYRLADGRISRNELYTDRDAAARSAGIVIGEAGRAASDRR